MSQGKTVSLVLGSGGARGLSHIGVIRYLEEQGYQIKSVAGCSMGALVGGIYAAGKLDEFEHWVRAVSKSTIFSLLDIAWEGSGLVKGDRIIATLKQLVGEQNIEELAIPFTAVAANVSTEKEVWIAKGCLFNAIRASISMPLFFTPFEFNGQSLIDGGVLNPVPIAPTFGDHNDLTIAVNLGAPPEALQPWEPVPEPVEGGPEEPFYRDMVKRFVDKFGDAGSTMLGKNFSAYDIASQSIDAMQGAIARQKLAAYPPDKVIDIPRNACGVLEFDKAAQMIDLGYSRAAAALPPVKA